MVLCYLPLIGFNTQTAINLTAAFCLFFNPVVALIQCSLCIQWNECLTILINDEIVIKHQTETMLVRLFFSHSSNTCISLLHFHWKLIEFENEYSFSDKLQHLVSELRKHNGMIHFMRFYFSWFERSLMNGWRFKWLAKMLVMCEKFD